jgi:hypothetical protein
MLINQSRIRKRFRSGCHQTSEIIQAVYLRSTEWIHDTRWIFRPPANRLPAITEQYTPAVYVHNVLYLRKSYCHMKWSTFLLDTSCWSQKVVETSWLSMKIPIAVSSIISSKRFPTIWILENVHTDIFRVCRSRGPHSLFSFEPTDGHTISHGVQTRTTH